MEAEPTDPSTNRPAASSAPVTTTVDQPDSDATFQEGEELRRRRRRRRRRTVNDLPPGQKRFRLVLLGGVILALIVAASGKGLRPVLNNISQAIRGVVPMATLKQYARPELLLLVIAVFIMVILLFPDVEDKVLVTLGFRKAKRPHRTRSSRRRHEED